MHPIRPMVTNPGGVVDPADLIGRHREIDRLLRSVSTGGAKLLGDRRMGKTSLLRRVAHELAEVGHVVVRISAEATDTAQFSRELLSELRRNALVRSHFARWEAELGGELRIDVGPAGLVLKGSAARLGKAEELDLFRACANAAAELRPYRLVFIFDEITALAVKLGETDPRAPEQFLRTLRVPRQELSGIAMMLAGSVGLHHVLSDKSPVNDLDGIQVGPLDHQDAEYLARCLLRGAGIAEDDERAIAAAIVEQTSAIPFYIHKLVQEVSDRGLRDPRPVDIVHVVDDAIRDDLWEIQHYVDRIPSYYGNHAAVVLLMLDEYALADGPLSIEEVTGRPGSTRGDVPTRDVILSLVTRLEDDHYLTRVGASDRFATSLLRRAWRELRRLA